jgi:D-3-phosphoglycerate dehydrogenase
MADDPGRENVVVVTDHVFPDLDIERRMLSEAGLELRYERDAHTPQEVLAAAVGAVGILNCYTPIPAGVIEALEDRCRVIARYGIGIDSIDVEAATRRGIVVTNVPDYCIDEVSDHALALILGLARGVVRLDRSVHTGEWSPSSAGPLHRIRGRTLGLIGFGRIARRLGEKAAGLGYRVVATDPFVPVDAMEAAGAERRELADLLRESDVVSVHVPLSTDTHHLLGEEELSLMRPGAFLVNTSRGPVVNPGALRRALDEGRLGGAGLDVLETEPPDPTDPLVGHPLVVVTPHAAFSSEESVAELQTKAARQVVVALSGGIPPYAVNAAAINDRS